MKRIAIMTSLVCVLLICVARTQSQNNQHPLLDQVANKVIQKYQNSSCEQLWAERAHKAPPTPAEVKVVQFLKGDPQMRTLFLNKVAAPIANKMFECGMIP